MKYRVRLPKTTAATIVNELINNLINGNLKDAKNQARRFHVWTIRECLIAHGYSSEKATLFADWLKGRDRWQAACDAT